MIKAVSFTSLFILIFWYSAAQSFELDNIVYNLNNDSGICQLKIPKKNITIALKIPFPCEVHLDSEKVVRVVKRSQKKYIIIEHSIPHPVLPGDCKTSLQAVLINENLVRASEYFDVVASCPPYQWGMKIFTGLFKE